MNFYIQVDINASNTIRYFGIDLSGQDLFYANAHNAYRMFTESEAIVLVDRLSKSYPMSTFKILNSNGVALANNQLKEYVFNLEVKISAVNLDAAERKLTGFKSDIDQRCYGGMSVGIKYTEDQLTEIEKIREARRQEQILKLQEVFELDMKRAKERYERDMATLTTTKV